MKIFPCALVGGDAYIRALRRPFPTYQLWPARNQSAECRALSIGRSHGVEHWQRADPARIHAAAQARPYSRTDATLCEHREEHARAYCRITSPGDAAALDSAKPLGVQNSRFNRKVGTITGPRSRLYPGFIMYCRPAAGKILFATDAGCNRSPEYFRVHNSACRRRAESRIRHRPDISGGPC